MGVDVLFINSGACHTTPSPAVAPPVWAMLLAEWVRARGDSVAIHDANLDGFDSGVMDEYRPEAVVVTVCGHHPSASSTTVEEARRISWIVKDVSKAPVSWFGPHPSALREQVLRTEPCDWVSGVPPDIASGGYAFDLVDFERYRACDFHVFGVPSDDGRLLDVRSPYAVVHTSLGCPYSCSYCSVNAMFGGPRVMTFPLASVFHWLDGLAGRGVRNIRFEDELFTAHPTRVAAICDHIIERGYDFNIFAYARPEPLSPPLLSKMRAAGIRWLGVGIEAADHRVLSGVGKHIHGDIAESIGRMRDADINVIGNYMFGLPDDTRATMRATLDMALALRTEYVNFYTTMPVPGSALYDGRTDWSSLSQFSPDSRPISAQGMTPQEVVAFRDEAYRTYFADQDYLRMMAGRFGGNVAAYIRRNTSVPLVRKGA